MRFPTAVTLSAILLPLTSCVTSEQIGAGVHSFEGKPYKVAFDALGYPDQERVIDGKRVFTWSNQNSGSYSVPTSSTATTFVGGRTITTTIQGTRTESYDYNCKVDMVVGSSGIIEKAQGEGNIGGCERYAKFAPKNG